MEEPGFTKDRPLAPPSCGFWKTGIAVCQILLALRETQAALKDRTLDCRIQPGSALNQVVPPVRSSFGAPLHSLNF